MICQNYRFLCAVRSVPLFIDSGFKNIKIMKRQIYYLKVMEQMESSSALSIWIKPNGSSCCWSKSSFCSSENLQ